VADVDRYADRDEYARHLAEATAIFSVAELADRFDRHGIWWAPINYYDDLLADPQLSHAQVFRQVTVRGRTIYLVNHPNRYDGEVPALRCLALEIGEHTREILHELGYAEGEVKSLLASKAVVAASGVGAAVERKAS